MKALAFALSLAAATAVLAAPTTAGAAIYMFKTTLNGASETTPNASPGTGAASVLWNTDAHTATIHVVFQDLTAGNTASHIHVPVGALIDPAPVATTTPTFIGFPTGQTSGDYLHTFDLTSAASYRAGFITAVGGVPQAEAAILDALWDGTAYLNIHTTTFPGGEIRGFLRAVPEPGTWALMVGGFGLAGAALRRRRAAAAA